jgi:hypothetical protein
VPIEESPVSGAGPRQEKAARPSPASHFSATPSGANAKLVAKALQHIAPRGARPAEIIGIVKETTGRTLAFSSARHAIQQLSTRNEIEKVGKDSVWRWRGLASDRGQNTFFRVANDENGDSP